MQTSTSLYRTRMGSNLTSIGLRRMCCGQHNNSSRQTSCYTMVPHSTNPPFRFHGSHVMNQVLTAGFTTGVGTGLKRGRLILLVFVCGVQAARGSQVSLHEQHDDAHLWGNAPVKPKSLSAPA